MPFRSWVAALFLVGCSLLIPGPDATERSSPFDELIGTGRAEPPIEIPDPELRNKQGEPYAYTIRSTRWMPELPNGKVIVYSHGLQDHRGWFNLTATRLAELGYIVYAFDRIGSGQSSDGLFEWHGKLIRSRGMIHDWRLFVESLDAVLRRVRAENPNREIVLWGGGYGARIVSIYLLERRETLAARGVRAAVFTVPDLFPNSKKMPPPFSQAKVFASSPQTMFPLPMVESDGDRGAAWFVEPGPWFERIRNDQLSLREAARAFWIQTRKLDWRLDKHERKLRFPVPTFHLMVRGDPVVDNEKTEEQLVERVGDGIFKYYAGGADEKHFLLFSDAASEAIGDVDAFLSGRREAIQGAQHPEKDDS